MDVVTGLIAPLLEICMERLVRWENLPEDSDNPTVTFLNEDIDTVPERHAFVGNYRRYCSSVIETIVQKRPHDALPHILSRVDFTLNNLYDGVAPFTGKTLCTIWHRIGLTICSRKLHKDINAIDASRYPICSSGSNP